MLILPNIFVLLTLAIATDPNTRTSKLKTCDCLERAISAMRKQAGAISDYFISFRITMFCLSCCKLNHRRCSLSRKYVCGAQLHQLRPTNLEG